MKALKTIPIICLLVAACAQQQGKQAQSVQQAAPEQVVPLVEVQSAAIEAVNQDAEYSSTVQANVINNIASQSAGRIVKLNVEVGDFVAAGQILAEMDRVQLNQAELRLKNEKAELERVRGLLEEGGISQSDFDQLELSYNVSKATYDNLLENVVLRSPVSGVVTARNYDRGDMYAMAQPIYTVQQITPVKLLVGVSETDYTRVKKGDKVTITADALPDKEFEGSVIRIHPIMDAASHTFNVEVRVANSRRELRPGMYARARISFGVNNSIVVPDSAVLKQQGSGQKTVFVLGEDGTVALRMVTIGRHFNGKYEILSGLQEGEQVVVKGNATLKTGDKVEVK